MSHPVLDATGLQCPLPLLRARKVLKKLSHGQSLTVLATDPGAPQDFASYCELHDLTLSQEEEKEGVYRLVITK